MDQIRLICSDPLRQLLCKATLWGAATQLIPFDKESDVEFSQF
jgi:hypothetical protein